MARLRVEVARARPGGQEVVALELTPGSTVEDAVQRSGLGGGHAATGIFGKVCAPDTVLHDGDRVELYRPLSLDPKQARRLRARRQRR